MSEAGGIPITDGEKNRGGAFVAMDPRNGEVLAMGSYPSFDPNIFAKPLKQSTFNKLNSEENGAPLVDRAVNGLYPTGSTFKLITVGGRARVRDDHARHGDRRPGLDPDREHRLPQRGQYGPRRGGPARRAPGLLGRLLLPPGRPDERDRRQHPPEVGAPPGPRPAAPASTCRGSRRGSSPAPPGATACTARSSRTGPGRWATTSTSPSARATSRPRRSSSPPPTRPSSMTARCPRRTSACASRTRAGGCCRRSSRRRRAA